MEDFILKTAQTIALVSALMLSADVSALVYNTLVSYLFYKKTSIVQTIIFAGTLGTYHFY